MSAATPLEALQAADRLVDLPRERLVVIRTVDREPQVWYTLSNARATVPPDELSRMLDDAVRAQGGRHLGQALQQLHRNQDALNAFALATALAVVPRTDFLYALDEGRVIVVETHGDWRTASRLGGSRLRFSIIGPLLAAPPEPRQLNGAFAALAAKTWRHPITGLDVRFGASTLERWNRRDAPPDDGVAPPDYVASQGTRLQRTGRRPRRLPGESSFSARRGRTSCTAR